MRAAHLPAGLLAGWLIAGSALAQNLATPAKLTGPDVEAWLDGIVPFAIRSGDVAGAVVVVVKDGRVLVQKGYGYADVDTRRPVDPERTLFRIGSVGKLFTWTAVMQLVESGRLELDADINDYLDFEIPARDGEPITLRNLMTHTPGFEEVLKHLLTDDPNRLLPLEEYVKYWTPDRIFPPGEVPAYSNYGAALAGYIVQRVSGESFDAYMERHLFEPLGMAQATTRQPLPARFAPQMATGYVVSSGPAQAYELIGPSPAGGAPVAGADMARFMIVYLQGGRFGSETVLEPETVRRMLGTPLPVVPPLHAMLLGFMQQDLNGHRVAGHDGDMLFFHSALSLWVDDGVGLFFSMNSTGRNGAAIFIRSALVRGFADRYFPGPGERRSVDAQTAREHARLMAGSYRSSRRADYSFFNLAPLISPIEVKLGENDGLVIPQITGLDGQPLLWQEVQPFVWHEIGGKERLAAKLEDGEVVAFSMDSVSPYLVFQRVDWWRSPRGLVPLLALAFGAILLSVAMWPIGAIVRSWHGVAFPLTGREAKACRLVRIAGIASFAIGVAWLYLLTLVSTNPFVFSPPLDPWMLSLRVMTLVVFAGGVGAVGWFAWLAWSARRSRASRTGRAALVWSFLVLLWTAVVFELVGLSVSY